MKKLLGFLFGIIVVGVAVAVFITTLTRAILTPQIDQEMTVPLKSGETTAVTSSPSAGLSVASPSAPTRILIPAIGVNAPIQSVGISRRGTMAVSTNYTSVGWYRYGTMPGQTGNAVMAGHLDNGFGRPAVFKNLGSLSVGDEVIVLDGRGDTLHFSVTESKALTATTTDTHEVFRGNGTARLVLITCEGTWSSARKEYSDRRIVFADLSRIERAQSGI